MSSARISIRRHSVAGLVALAMVCLAARPAQAAPIGIAYNMTLTLLAGVDTLGLNGANVSFQAFFDDSVPYGDVASFPVALATSDSLTISGASVAGSNGTFSSNNGIRFFPTFAGQFFGLSGFANYTIGAVPLMIGHLATEVSGVIPGDLIEAADFGTTAASVGVSPGCVFCASTDTSLQLVSDSRYGVTSFSTSPVPEPATLTLLGIGLVAAARARRKQT
jgi:hypothetical protein